MFQALNKNINENNLSSPIIFNNQIITYFFNKKYTVSQSITHQIMYSFGAQQLRY